MFCGTCANSVSSCPSPIGTCVTRVTLFSTDGIVPKLCYHSPISSFFDSFLLFCSKQDMIGFAACKSLMLINGSSDSLDSSDTSRTMLLYWIFVCGKGFLWGSECDRGKTGAGGNSFCLGDYEYMGRLYTVVALGLLRPLLLLSLLSIYYNRLEFGLLLLFSWS